MTDLPHVPDRPGRRGAAALLVVAAAVLTACGASAGAAPTPAGPSCGPGAPRLTVQATGQASTTPDVLTVQLGVSVTDPTAVAALADAARQGTTLDDDLRFVHVPPSDLQTTDLSLGPVTDAAGRITGYQVDDELQVTFTDVPEAGAVIDAAASAVGDAVRLDGVTFSVSDRRDVDGRARAQAVTVAADHARAMAAAAGERLGGVCTITDTTSSPVPQTFAAADLAGQTAAALPVEAGSQQSTATVDVVYALIR
jgi:uncharacterized protein YggE